MQLIRIVVYLNIENELNIKTMDDLLERFEALNLNSDTIPYKLVKEAIENRGIKIRPCWTTGRKQFIKNNNYTYEVILILRDKLNASYEFGNDAPRGGKTGNYIIVL